ncbi:hypothetical protein ACH5RR_039626 [Cinchona calisaya]|uniref:Uncharacterized protein n=1 Tax=Cinchona calisaya TaxID=153742 RepID=A0ABD2XZ87_9GENT
MASASSSKSSDAFDSDLREIVDNLKTTDLTIFVSLHCDLQIRCLIFLAKVVFYVHQSTNAYLVVPNWVYMLCKIRVAITDVCCFPEQTTKKNIELCWEEIAEALDHLSVNCGMSGSLEWQLPVLLAPSFCFDFLMSISLILECIGDPPDQQADQNLDESLREQVKVFQCEMISPLRYFLEDALVLLKDHHVISAGCNNLPSDHHMIYNNFLTHIACVVVKIANQSCLYWIDRIVNPVVAESKLVELLDMQHEIDPLTPEFLELILKFLRTLVRISPVRGKELVSSFIYDIILDKGYSIEYESRMKLEPVIIFDCIGETEEPSSEDVKSLMDEIKAMLLLLGVSSRGMELVHLSSAELHKRICLLNVEVLLKQQLNCTSELEQLLIYLGSFSDEPQKEIVNEKQTCILVVEVAEELAALYQSCHCKTITEDRIRRISLLKIVLFKAKSSCQEFQQFLDGNANVMGIENEQIETLLEGLNLFNAFVTNQQVEMKKDTELLFSQIEISARGITSLYYSFISNKIRSKMIISVSDLLASMTITKARLGEICPQIPRSNFPKTCGRWFIAFLLENLAELLRHGPDSIVVLKCHIERIWLDLDSLRSFLMMLGHLESKDLGTRVTDVAHEAEYIIDSIEVGIGDHWQHLLWLHDLLEEIRLVKIQTTDIYEEKTCNARIHNVAHISSHTTSQLSKPEIGGMVVCLHDVEDVVIDRLTRGSSERDIVSIIGMPGIGKTTLAKKVYYDPKVTFHFHVRAWCSVSQGYAKRDLLLDILSDICGLDERIHQMTDEDLDLKLYQSLKQKRYLIVMDDVWDDKAWNALERSFPNDSNGSRIIITSRLHDVALKAKPDSDPYSLRLLSDIESWKLLQMKIFHGTCPDELLEVGKEIAKNCKGLPLAVVAIAGILERTEKKQDKWKKVAESLNSRIIDDPQSRCKDILQLSYKELPDNLKPCLLYFGAFLEDKDVPICKLIRLWIAEGFIQKSTLKSFEDLAEDYLIDLIGRSLVTVSKRGSRGKVKSCRVHDLVRELCLSKAKGENFLQLITGEDEPYASFSDLDCGADFYDYCPSNPVRYEGHRISIHLKRKHFVNSRPYGQCARSLIFFASSDTYPRRPYDVSFIPHHFKLLRVLDLESINLGMSFPTGIELLVQLRYLAISGDIKSVPPSIANLWKLETLIVKGLKVRVELPNSIWCMKRLRHLHVNDHVDFIFQDGSLGNSLQLENLVSFSSPSLAYGKVAKKILRRLPNLRKLGCIYLESWNEITNYNKFPTLDFLVQLESLKILYFGRSLNLGEFTLPWNLKKLSLSYFRLPWIHISAVGKLQNLEVLKLLSKAFEGRRWDMREGEFLKLKYLKLDTLNIAQWNASNDHLPHLQQLVLRNCKDLEGVPYTFSEIPTLQLIEVQSCRQSTEVSVRNIEEEGIEGLKIIINNNIYI